ncbi:Histone-lysine N-methyltransferase ash1 [Lachnellula suecica]|uniref:Histone-lysine N-methyltransferase ash1 n=1 Tax=Lachnellula suecica TaxID=602035 RepID=A0A8T9BUP7_9HELO|nr:Histone-lysine N-methyltransferase ash1 [Lachnellula suecica]
MFSTLLSQTFNRQGPPLDAATRAEETRPSSPESVLSTIAVDDASSNVPSASSTPPTSIGDSASVSSASLNPDPAQSTTATPAEPSRYSRRSLAPVPTYNIKKLAGTAVHAPRKYLLGADGLALPPKPPKVPKRRRRRTISSGATLLDDSDDSDDSDDEPLRKDANKLVNDGIDALDLQWSVNKKLPKSRSLRSLPSSVKKLPKKQGVAPKGSRSRKSEPFGVISKTLNAFGKRSRKVFEEVASKPKNGDFNSLYNADGSKKTREQRRLQDTLEFKKIDKVPVKEEVWSNGKLVQPESSRKRRKTEQAAEEAKSEEVKLPEKKKPAGKKEKTWLQKGLYAGQESKTNLDWFHDYSGEKAKDSLPQYKPTGLMPLPMWHGQRLLHTGRDFKLPFDVCSPLPPGQAKPENWKKTSTNRFVGEAASLWKKEDIFDSFSSKCVCTKETGCGENCQNRIMLYECNDTICAAGPEHCKNRAFADLTARRKRGGKYDVGVETVKTADRGFGVRSNRCFEANQIIVEYTGEIITEDECDRRMNEVYKDNECYYLMSFDQNMILDGTVGSIARFVNHACKPNCRMVKWLVNGKPRMALFAGDNPVMTGEELTYDYNFDPFSAKNVQECRCGSSNCRGVLGPKPKDVKPPRIMSIFKAHVKKAKRKLKDLLAAEEDSSAEKPSPKKRKYKKATGLKRSASSASIQIAKGAAKAIKKSVSTSFLNPRNSIGSKRGGGRAVAIKKTRVNSVKRVGKVGTKASSRHSSYTLVGSPKSLKSVKSVKTVKSVKGVKGVKGLKGSKSPKSPKGSKSPPPKMSSVGKRSAKKTILGSDYDDRSGTPSRGETIRVIDADSDDDYNE